MITIISALNIRLSIYEKHKFNKLKQTIDMVIRFIVPSSIFIRNIQLITLKNYFVESCRDQEALELDVRRTHLQH